MHLLRRLKHNRLAQLFIVYTRYLIGGTFVFASIIKIKGERFTAASGADAPIASAWHFFETLYQSGLYWQFIGTAQFVAGMLLLTQRYARLGAVLFFPIILNIFIITLSYEFAYTPVVTGMMLLATLALVLWEWDTLRVLVNQPAQPINGNLPYPRIWEAAGLGIFLFTAGYRILYNQYDPILWGGVSGLMGLTTLAVFLYRQRMTTKPVVG